MEFFEALQSNALLFYAVIAGLLASICSGIIGSYVVVKRIVFISGSIAHSVLGGIGFCVWLERAKNVSWMSPLYGALAAGIISALIMGWIHLHYRQREDTVIAAVWSVGMAIGIIFMSQTPGFNVELTSFPHRKHSLGFPRQSSILAYFRHHRSRRGFSDAQAVSCYLL